MARAARATGGAMTLARAAAVALLLAILHTWPLATAPGTHSLNANGDVMLNEWIVAWVQHQLPRAPLALFQANIFHPAPDALAFSEPLVVPALIGAPIRILGGSPVLVHNVLLIAGLALTMLGGSALALHWTGDRLASLVAGAAFAFNTQSLMRLEHLQAAHAYGLPLALLAGDRLVQTGGRRHALWLAVWMTMMAYTSGYLVIFACVALALLVAVRLAANRRHARAAIAGLVVAATIATAAALPLLLAYRRVSMQQGMQHSLDGVGQYSAALDGYVASHGQLHQVMWDADGPRTSPDAFFPGVVVSLLGATAIGAAWRGERRSIVAALVVVAAAGCVLSLGVRTPLYGWLYAVFPPMAAIRGASRFGALFLLATAILAGLGLAAARGRLGRRAATAAAGAALVLVTAEAVMPPIAYTPFNGIPGIYRLLAEEPGPVVLAEVPFYRPAEISMNAGYVLNSTAHWRPLMNGYSGFTPPTYWEVADAFARFPEPSAIEAMRASGVTHVMVHPERFERDGIAILHDALAADLERIAVGPRNLTLFRLR